MSGASPGAVAPASGLVVPVDVVAYCVGDIDAHERTGGFSGATTSYVAMASDNKSAAFLGANVTRDPVTQPPLWPLEAGVHLHWAMPDGLTHATPGDDADGLAFPALPNRWLVTRHVVHGSTITGRSWILESDTLSADPPGGANAPSLPVADSNQNFRYLGVWDVFDASWQEPDTPPQQQIATLFGSPIHAVASGDVAFAAFYPNARGVFGIVDEVSDLTISGSDPLALSYTVIGWYSAPENDPLTKTQAPADLEAKYHWTYQPDASTPNHSLYCGLVQGIQWNPATEYVADPQPVDVDLAIGESPAQALAAYFAGRNHPTLPLFEQLFTAFEMGLLSTLKQPKPGQLAALTETVHASGFTDIDAGGMYSVVAATKAGPKAGLTSALDDDDPAPNLPLPLADALNLLNEVRQQSDLATLGVQQYKWQLFADWYRLVQASQENSQAASNTLSARLAQWPAVQQVEQTAQAALTSQLGIVDPMLGTQWQLKEVPAPRFQQPGEPVVLLAGADVALSARHGGDGRFHPSGNLVCRLTTALVTSVTVAAGTTATITATEFPQALPPTQNHLLYAADVAALVGEAVVLNTTLAAALCQGAPADLEAALTAYLIDSGKTPKGNAYQAMTGTAPSPVQVSWWGPGNPWLPLLMLWELDFVPLSPTAVTGTVQDLQADFFTGNFAVDPDNVGAISYAPTPGKGGIVVDPATLAYNPKDGVAAKYTGVGVLSTTAADNLASALTQYLDTTKDATLQAILDDLADTTIVLQSMAGLNAAFLSRDQSLQLSIGVGPGAPFSLRTLTNEVKAVVTDLTQIPPQSPDFAGSFNPIRAGFAKVGVTVLDAFGERRPVRVDNLYLSSGLSTTHAGTVEPGIVYLQPRLCQGARLLFRWLSADTLEYDEMNAHPATSPVCGWLLTNHLQEGIFFYDQLGHPLGSLTLATDLSGIQWQAAPGNDATIGQSVATVMQDVNPHLRDVAVALSSASVADFQAFYQAVDTAATSVSAPTADTGAGLAVLVGRPVALVQASLLLELQGTSAYDQTWNTLVPGHDFEDSDDGLGTVQVPAVVGDIDQLDDGLVGYFVQDKNGSYDLSAFYSEAAAATAKAGDAVVRPGPTTVLLTPQSTPEGQAPSVTAGERKLLMLLDPRAGVHLTSGILPTQYIQIPSNQYADTLRGLEMTFLTTPVVKPLTGLTLPLGAEAGYAWSFVEEDLVVAGTGVNAGEARNGGTAGPRWQVTPGVGPATATGLWQYTPQQLTEGWLRLNPEVLTFRLSNGDSGSQVTAGQPDTLTLTITNRRQTDVTFTPGALAPEGTPATGSVIYIHVGALMTAANVPTLQPSAPGWTFRAMSDAQYGAYWAATPVAGAPVSLAPGEAMTVALSNIVAVSTACQAQVGFDYYHVDGVDDGVDLTVVAILPPQARATTRRPAV